MHMIELIGMIDRVDKTYKIGWIDELDHIYIR